MSGRGDTVQARIATPATVPAEDAVYASWKRNLLFVWIGVFVGLLGASFVFPFIPLYIEELGVTKESSISYLTGITASATGLSLTLTAPLWGSMADKYGRKPMFLRALVGAGVIIGVMGLVTAVWQLVLLRFLMGAFAGTMGAAAALVAASTPREKSGQALGLLQTAAFSSSMIGPFIGGVVASNLGIRNSFLFCATLYVVAAGLAFFFVREGKMQSDEDRKDGKHGGSGSLAQNLRVVMAEKQVLIVLGLLFCLNLSNTFVRPVQPISIDHFANGIGDARRVPLHLPFIDADLKVAMATGVLFGVIGGTSTLAALAVSPLGSRFGYQRAIVIAAIAAGALYIPMAFVNSYSTFLLSFGAVGLFQGAMLPGTNAILAAHAPDGKHGSVFGVAASMQSMALLVGPLGGGFVSGTFGNHAVYVVIGVVLVLAGLVAWRKVREPEIYHREVAAH